MLINNYIYIYIYNFKNDRYSRNLQKRKEIILYEATNYIMYKRFSSLKDPSSKKKKKNFKLIVGRL